MPGTFLPLVLLPEVTFVQFPYALTIEGQYIIKNLVMIGAFTKALPSWANQNAERSGDGAGRRRDGP